VNSEVRILNVYADTLARWV